MNEKPVFATEVDDNDLYPMLKSINLEVNELINPGWKKPTNTYHVNKDNLKTYFRCTNPLCSGGGASITSILSEAIRNKETAISGGEHCGSNETSGRHCLQFFRIKGEITYK